MNQNANDGSATPSGAGAITWVATSNCKMPQPAQALAADPLPAGRYRFMPHAINLCEAGHSL